VKQLFLKTNLKLTKCVFRSCNVWKLSKELSICFTSNGHCNVHQLFIATSLQLLLPVIQTLFFSVPRFSIRRKRNPQKLKVIFSDHNRRSFTTQKLPVIRYFKTVNQKLIFSLTIFNFREFLIFRLCALNLLRYLHA
jgi:hypothetical protein